MKSDDDYHMAVISPGAKTLDDMIDDRYLHLDVIRHTSCR